MKHTIIKSLLVTTSLTPFISFTITSCAKKNKDIVILFTNDTHCTLENADTGLGWAQLKGYREWLETKGCDTLLVDAGDFAQGGVYGTLNKGKYITSLLNACEYDLTIPGNHEFDYGMSRFNEIVNELNCPMISANFYNYDYKTGNVTTPVLNQTAILKAGGKKIGFVGASTPQTMISSNPSNFKDAEGNQIYDFLGSTDETPTKFYSTIQSSIDSLKSQNVDYIIGLTHLGVGNKGEYAKYGSQQLIANTSGFDVVIDGHSHTYQPAIKIKDKNARDVYLSQTGSGFESFGQLLIHNNKLTFSLINSTNEVSADVQNVIDDIKAESDVILSKEIGSIDFPLTINDSEGRVVRSKECNMGDFYADAVVRAVGDINNDIGIYNGGGIRASLGPNKVTYGDFLTSAPFGNSVGRIMVSGQTLLDALEYSVCKFDSKTSEFGGFLQLGNGMEVQIDLNIPTPVVLDENGGFEHIKTGEPRRVVSAKFQNQDIQVNLSYTIVSSTFTIFDFGDGYNMFKDGVKLESKAILEVDCIIDYFKHIISPGQEELLASYANPQGQGRITYI